jgi:hypothetical protein
MAGKTANLYLDKLCVEILQVYETAPKINRGGICVPYDFKNLYESLPGFTGFGIHDLRRSITKKANSKDTRDELKVALSLFGLFLDGRLSRSDRPKKNIKVVRRVEPVENLDISWGDM